MDRGKRILIIEDHDSLRTILGSVLSKNFQVTAVKDGLEGLTVMSKGYLPELIILDLMMPRMNGIEFLKNIRNSGFFQHIPVFVVSSIEKSKYSKQFTELGIQGYFEKPFDPESLKEQVSSIFELKQKMESM